MRRGFKTLDIDKGSGIFLDDIIERLHIAGES